MTTGKTSAQTGHAFTKCLARCSPELVRIYEPHDDIGTKVTLSAPSEEWLIWAHQQAIQHGLNHYLVIDEGHVMLPHFTGAKIVTALGIGPAMRHEVEHITRKFNKVS